MGTLERRVEVLEQLPARVAAVESQIVQLRDEMRSEFSALHGEIRAGDEHVVETLREEIRAGDEHVVKTLREEIRAGDAETRRVLTERMEFLFDANERHMRLLHEDLVQRIATIREGRP
jgi:hypothetical protein